MQNFVHVLSQEIAYLFSLHKRAILMLCFIPFLYTLLFGGLFYQNTVLYIPIGICNLDEGKEGNTIAKELTKISEVSVVATSDDLNSLQNMLAKQEIYAIVVIPPDFSQRVNRYQSANIEAIANNTSTLIGKSSLTGIQSVVATYSAEKAVLNRVSTGSNLANAQNNINLSVRNLYNSTGGYEDFFLMILSLHALQIATVFVLAPMFVHEKKLLRQRIAKYFYSTLIAKVIVYTLLVSSIMLVCTVFAINMFSLTYRSDFSDVFMLIVAFAFAMVSFALCVASWVNKDTNAITYTVFYIMPSVLFTGAIWPRVSMDNFSYFISYIVPISYVASDLRTLLLRGEAPLLHQDILCLLIFGLICLTFATRGLKSYLQKSSRKDLHDDSCNLA